MLPDIYEPWTEDLQLWFVQIQHRQTLKMMGKRFVFDDAEKCTDKMDQLQNALDMGVYDICCWME
jgi:hypothetical protein